jgi:integrase
MIGAGLDPIEVRKAGKARGKLEEAQAMSFKACAEAYIAGHRAQWRSATHAAQWHGTLAAYAYPILGAVPVQKIDVGLVVKVLQPIWVAKTETASRLRGRIENVLDWARAHGYRHGENPALWRGHLDKILPRRTKVRTVQHHAAIPYQEVGTLMSELRSLEGVAARALEFTILTAARTGEVLGARPAEFDLVEAVWTVPATRIKGGRSHRVPLGARAATIVGDLMANQREAFVFPGSRPATSLHRGAIWKILRNIGRTDVTVHGFRSTFRDWVAEQTGYPRELAEMALAHAIESKVESAYRRGDVLEKRRLLMADWEKYCSAPFVGGKVLP